jgi:hypothetical protein
LPEIQFDRMPADARVWVFGASEPIRGAAAERLLATVRDFVTGWLAHGHPVVGASDWRHDHFLLIAADEKATGVSGCSIDSLFRTLKGIEQSLGTTLLDSGRIWFRDSEGSVRSVERSKFRTLVDAGEIDDETMVFDNTVASAGAVRAGEWEKRFAESWHAKAFRRLPAQR